MSSPGQMCLGIAYRVCLPIPGVGLLAFCDLPGTRYLICFLRSLLSSIGLIAYTPVHITSRQWRIQGGGGGGVGGLTPPLRDFFFCCLSVGPI